MANYDSKHTGDKIDLTIDYAFDSQWGRTENPVKALNDTTLPSGIYSSDSGDIDAPEASLGAFKVERFNGSSFAQLLIMKDTSNSYKRIWNVSVFTPWIAEDLPITDYLPLAGGTVTGQIKGVVPISDEDLTRKDYVDTEITDAIAAIPPPATLDSHIGQLIHTSSTSTPTELGYEGTWVKLAADTFIISGDVANMTPTGSNTPAVPLLQHKHANTVAANSIFSVGATNSTGAHGHNLYIQQVNRGEYSNVPNTGTNTGISGEEPASSTSALYKDNGLVQDAGAHTHTVTGTVATTVTPTNVNAGTAGATLDVRGLRVVAVTWHRTV
jgi:hypothetical protein